MSKSEKWDLIIGLERAIARLLPLRGARRNALLQVLRLERDQLLAEVR